MLFSVILFGVAVVAKFEFSDQTQRTDNPNLVPFVSCKTDSVLPFTRGSVNYLSSNCITRGSLYWSSQPVTKGEPVTLTASLERPRDVKGLRFEWGEG
ncbi:MAG: hypothetical protein KVP17_001954 [Porospora cf. gigantea B]|uniref:uncharacterized protein n=1 Tax=Porospora cf. gigantea B TaxID=2853592 RepID=UPI003571EE88|nr:MAG: hypothetical protein KVP17_001954 [Porospora cf. gigantea B]